MYKHFIVSASILAALTLAGCANHVPPVPRASAKITPSPAAAQYTKERESEGESGIDAVKAYGMDDATAFTEDGRFDYALIGSPVGTTATATAGRVVRATDDSNMGWTCPDYQKRHNGDVSACSVPRVVLVISTCLRWACPRSNEAFVAVVPPKDAPKIGDVVTVLRGPGAGEVRVINDGFLVDDPVE